MGSSFRPELPITDIGECVTGGDGRQCFACLPSAFAPSLLTATRQALEVPDLGLRTSVFGLRRSPLVAACPCRPKPRASDLELQASDWAPHSSRLLIKRLSFHQYNGKQRATTFLFSNIMERLISDIFPPFVFNNIMEDTFIFSPRVFLRPCRQESSNCIMFNDIGHCDIFAVYR